MLVMYACAPFHKGFFLYFVVSAPRLDGSSLGPRFSSCRPAAYRIVVCRDACSVTPSEVPVRSVHGWCMGGVLLCGCQRACANSLPFVQTADRPDLSRCLHACLRVFKGMATAIVMRTDRADCMVPTHSSPTSIPLNSTAL
jgi:hypothetical protein